MTQRLTPKLEAEIRSELGEVPGYIADYLRPLLGEVDALRTERDRLRDRLGYLEAKYATWNGDTYDMPLGEP